MAGELLFRPLFLRIPFPATILRCNPLVLYTIERHNQALYASSHDCKLLIAKEMVGASGFEPPSSWSRTRLDQTKSVELTAFTCAFSLLIWATWATKSGEPLLVTPGKNLRYQHNLTIRPIDGP